MRSLIIFLVAICLAKFANAIDEDYKIQPKEQVASTTTSSSTGTQKDATTSMTPTISSGDYESDVKPVEKEPKIVNKITPREYIARRVIVELGKAGYTVSSQKVSF